MLGRTVVPAFIFLQHFAQMTASLTGIILFIALNTKIARNVGAVDAEAKQQHTLAERLKKDGSTEKYYEKGSHAAKLQTRHDTWLAFVIQSHD